MKVAALILSTVAAAAGASADADAAIIGYVQTPQGRIEVHDEPGQCVGDARRADFVPVGGERISGCWVVRGSVVAVVFLDGDVAQVPVVFLQKPAPA